MFDVLTWEGEVVSRLGSPPEGSTLKINPKNNRSALSSNKIPPSDKANVFPVNDLTNSGEYFLVYSAIPRIDKHTSEGEKLWTSDVPEVMEIEEYNERHREVLQEIIPSAWISLNKYTAGVGSPAGDLFLATNTNPEVPRSLWIHQFDNKGELKTRYKFNSEVNIPCF